MDHANPALDIHTTAGKLADLDQRIEQAVHAGSAAAVEKQHAKGKLTARERIELLLDEGSFTELDGLARHRATTQDVPAQRAHGDGHVVRRVDLHRGRAGGRGGRHGLATVDVGAPERHHVHQAAPPSSVSSL